MAAMPEPTRRPLRRLLALLLASIAVNAALGIYALVVPDFGELQARILLTSVCVTGAGVFTLACLPAWERRRLSPLPEVSVAVSVLGFAVAVGAVWAQAAGGAALAKAAGTLLCAGGAGALSSLLVVARLAPRFRWALPPALVLVFLLVALIVSAIWGEWETEWFARSVGVVAVLAAAFIVAIPVLDRASRRELARPEPAAVLVRFCPGCGSPVEACAEEAMTCPGCGARFRVQFQAPPAVDRPVARPGVAALPREAPAPPARARPGRGT